MGKESVCVTGAGGYIASWVVKLLLDNGYKVHGTVRDPSDPKNDHLKALEGARENLQLFKADLLDYGGLSAAIDGCRGVLHVASPVPVENAQNPEVELYEPAITGTKNVLNACLERSVKKVVVVSSVAAVVANPAWPEDRPMDEDCWSDLDFCKMLQLWYCVAKTLAETEAREFATRTGLNVVRICPSVVIGPMLQPTMNASSSYLLNYMKANSGEASFLLAGTDPSSLGGMGLVDVRDTAEAILIAYENPEAEGRYTCSPHITQVEDLVEKLKSLYPEYDYPRSFKEVQRCLKLSSVKLQTLGWKYRPLEESLVDAVENYRELGVLSRITKTANKNES